VRQAEAGNYLGHGDYSFKLVGDAGAER